MTRFTVPFLRPPGFFSRPFHSVQAFARAGFFSDRFPAAKGFFSARLGLLFRPFRAGTSPLHGSIPCRFSPAQGSF